MKKTILIFATIAIIAITGIFVYNSLINKNPVTKKEFNAAHFILNTKLDSLQTIVSDMNIDLDSIKFNQSILLNNQKILKNNQDSLKKGQKIIFEEIANSNKNFLSELLKNW